MDDKKIILCACGCGQPVNIYKGIPRKFIKYHCIPMKNKTHSIESRKKMSESSKGKIHSEETKIKIGKSSKGHIVTEEMKKSMSEKQKGEKNHNYGKKTSDEIKIKISNSGKGLKRSNETRKKISEARIGRKLSEETILKISKSAKGRDGLKGEKNPMYGKKGEKNPFYGKKHSEQTKNKLAEITKKHIALNGNPMLGGNHTFESRMKMSQTKKKNNNIDESNEKWNEFLTPTYNAIRNSYTYKEWKKNIFKRDNYTCKFCGDDKGGNLNAHHKKTFFYILQKNNINTLDDALICTELWDTDNGITLCTKCHKREHKKNRNSVL
jgi:hypothetical protein